MNKKAADHVGIDRIGIDRVGIDRVGAGVERSGAGPLVGARRALSLANFSLWSLRGRTGQLVPVALAFLLLVGAV